MFQERVFTLFAKALRRTSWRSPLYGLAFIVVYTLVENYWRFVHEICR